MIKQGQRGRQRFFTTLGITSAFQTIACIIENMYQNDFKIPRNVVRDGTDAHPRLIVVVCFNSDTNSLSKYRGIGYVWRCVCNDSRRGLSCNYRHSN